VKKLYKQFEKLVQKYVLSSYKLRSLVFTANPNHITLACFDRAIKLAASETTQFYHGDSQITDVFALITLIYPSVPLDTLPKAQTATIASLTRHQEVQEVASHAEAKAFIKRLEKVNNRIHPEFYERQEKARIALLQEEEPIGFW